MIPGHEDFLEPSERPITKREADVLRLLSDGLDTAEIAASLFISPETVKSHVRHIRSKLESHTRTQAVAEAIRRGVID